MNPEQWDRLCRALGDETLRLDPRFATNAQRLQNHREMRARVEAVLTTATTAEWVERFEKAQIAAGPIYEFDEAFEDPQVLQLGLVTEIDQPGQGRVRMLTTCFSPQPPQVKSAARLRCWVSTRPKCWESSGSPPQRSTASPPPARSPSETRRLETRRLRGPQRVVATRVRENHDIETRPQSPRAEGEDPSTRISLVRHGRVHNPGGVFYGRLPGFGLGDLGRREARWAALALGEEPIAAMFSSPLLRARQTAREILRAHGHLRLRTSRLLTEVHNPYEGRSTAEVDSLEGDVYSGSGLEFEQPSDVFGRVERWTRRMRRQYAGRHVIAVTHGDPIAFLVLWAAGKPVVPKNKAALAPHGIAGGYPATGSITTFCYAADRPDERPTVEHQRPLL